jgi:hypothetical protein
LKGRFPVGFSLDILVRELILSKEVRRGKAQTVITDWFGPLLPHTADSIRNGWLHVFQLNEPRRSTNSFIGMRDS